MAQRTPRYGKASSPEHRDLFRISLIDHSRHERLSERRRQQVKEFLIVAWLIRIEASPGGIRHCYAVEIRLECETQVVHAVDHGGEPGLHGFPTNLQRMREIGKGDGAVHREI